MACSTCNGDGWVTCPKCGGSGTNGDDTCGFCSGSGAVGCPNHKDD